MDLVWLTAAATDGKLAAAGDSLASARVTLEIVACRPFAGNAVCIVWR